MEKLINIATKIGKKIKTSDIQGIYNTLVSDIFFRPLCLSLGGNSTVKLIFLIKAYKDGRELQDMLYRLETDLFTFSLIEVSADDVEETCSSCGGDEYVDCHNCDGGYDECSDCGGDGEDAEGDSCNTCDGEGRTECEWCDGDGRVSCDDCGGTGYVTDDFAANIEVLEYVSVDYSLFNVLEIFGELQEFDKFTILEKSKNNYTFLIRKFSSTSYNDEIIDNKNSTLFDKLNKEPEFVMNNSRQMPLLDSGLDSFVS